MEKYYTDEQNAQVILSLLKQHHICKVVASPGTTNMALVASMMNDSFFEIYSSVDERSAAYIACGLAAESGEPVVLSCTGATASRNYLPALTEAYYRKLPILAITSTQSISKIGHHIAQVIDRSVVPNDVAKLSVTLPIVKDEDDLWSCVLNVNRAILELKRNGGGPVHINLPTKYSRNYEIKELPRFRKIERITSVNLLPSLSFNKIGIFVGSHKDMSKSLAESIERFCASNNAIVFCDHTSGYYGKYRVQLALAAAQPASIDEFYPDLLIHIGEVTGDYYTLKLGCAKEVWRVSEDGELRDTFKKLTYVFEMTEQSFFDSYSQLNGSNFDDSYFQSCVDYLENINANFPNFPFSNIWIASKLCKEIPINSVVHFGILNSLRSWNFFKLSDSIRTASNVGGFGIDGGMSTLIGASLVNKDKLYFGVIGDLAFFYDLNSIGNRHIGNNLRILLINNGKGAEFRLYTHKAAIFGDEADHFIAAAGHYGNKSKTLIKHYAEDLGFKYLVASNKIEFEQVYSQFVTEQKTACPILFEVFTDSNDESLSLNLISNIIKSEISAVQQVKNVVQNILGEKAVNIVKKIVK